MIKKITMKSNVVMVNKHHNEEYKNKRGIIIIEDTDNKKYILDLESSTDISSSDYIEILDTKNTKEKVVFENIMFNNELLKMLSGK